MSDAVLAEISGGIGTITLNKPWKLNAWDTPMRAEITAQLNDWNRDPAVRVLLLRGAGGKAFVAGTDIAQFQNLQTESDALAYERRMDDVLDRLERVTRTTIAQVQGVAAGAGCAAWRTPPSCPGLCGQRCGKRSPPSVIPLYSSSRR